MHRSEQLAKAYGYHLYLPESSLDRDLNHFLELLKSAITTSLCMDLLNIFINQ
ncbi:DUF2982 domain-containing protein [Psychromonas sp. KJ10-10]|uniref:DUF2982 domain-containing protein n=1 Tax=Psychromonas sp. KJ10-10 TaxID=3391823 RepID=UPI0039B4D723